MKKAFLAYFTLGYPDIETTKEVIEGAIDGGATGIEIGLPFSDPVADGETIQYAHNISLLKGTKVDDLFFLMEKLGDYRKKADFYVMGYLNSIINAPCGKETFLKKAKEYDIKGLIIPDLPFSEIKRGKEKIDFPTVFFATNDTPKEAIKEYPSFNPPFIYYIARYGTTGEREILPEDILVNIQDIKSLIGDTPLYIGFGISKPQHVKILYQAADGVIVGSHLIKLIIKHEKDGPKKIRQLIKDEVSLLLG